MRSANCNNFMNDFGLDQIKEAEEEEKTEIINKEPIYLIQNVTTEIKNN